MRCNPVSSLPTTAVMVGPTYMFFIYLWFDFDIYLLLPAQYAVSVSWSPHHLHCRKMDLTGALWTSAPGCWPSHYIFTIYIPIFHSANGEHSAVLEVLILLKCKAKRCLELQSYKCIFVEDIKLTLLTLFQFSDFFRNEMKMSWCTAESISLEIYFTKLFYLLFFWAKFIFCFVLL